MNVLNVGRKLTVGKKIGSGFGLVIVLLLTVSFVSWHGLDKVKNALTGYNELNEQTSLADQFLTDLLNVQMNVKDYILSGESRFATAYSANVKKMEAFLLKANKQGGSKQQQELALIEDNLQNYTGAFTEINGLMDSRSIMVHRLMNELGPAMVSNLEEIMVTANNEGDAVAAFLAGMALKSLMSPHILTNHTRKHGLYD